MVPLGSQHTDQLSGINPWQRTALLPENTTGIQVQFLPPPPPVQEDPSSATSQGRGHPAPPHSHREALCCGSPARAAKEAGSKHCLSTQQQLETPWYCCSGKTKQKMEGTNCMNFDVLPLLFAQRTQQSDHPQHTAEDAML